MKRLLPFAAAAALWLCSSAQAATPGISGNGPAPTATAATFNLTAGTGYLTTPDGATLYSWGYGCTTGTGISPTFVPANLTTAAAPVAPACSTMQIPGPTLVVTEGATVTVVLSNTLPKAAGNTSILFPGFTLTSTCPAGQQGLLTCEALPGGAVTYTFVATTPGTRSYYSGTQSDLQVEMGLYGAIIVLPKSVPADCTTGLHALNPHDLGELDFRLAASAYDHPGTCYDREYLFQFAEADPRIHAAVLSQVNDPKRGGAACAAGAGVTDTCSLQVSTEPYHPSYFFINGRSMPDDMEPNYDPIFPHQPYNGNPHMHPGEVTLLRVIGQGRWQHPFHEHANHVRILGRDGNLILAAGNAAAGATSIPAAASINYNGTSPGAAPATSTAVAGTPLAGRLEFTTDTTPGQAFDGLFYFTGKGLNWDPYAHNPSSSDTNALQPCVPDANGYFTAASNPPPAAGATNYFEWCADHNKPIENAPLGDVNAGGPMTLPQPNIFTNGPWYGGTPYLGPDATVRASSQLPAGRGNNGTASGCLGAGNGGNPATMNCTNLQPSNIQANPANERGWAFMWHSHAERELTTNNVFPGGFLMMMLVDSREFAIDESK